LAIQPRALEVLAGLGVTGDLVAQSNPVRLHVLDRELAMPLKAEDGANDERQVGTPTLELAPCEHRNIFMQHRRGRMRNPP
jgi:hypothetical protein